MAFEFLEPTVTIISILGFTFYIVHRLEDKVDKLSEQNCKDHDSVNKRLADIEVKLK